MEGQLSHIMEELFQQVSEYTVIFNCAGKIKFMNDKAVNKLQQLNIHTSFFRIAENNNEKWNEFVQSVIQNNASGTTFELYNDMHQRMFLRLSGHYIPEKQFILGQIQFSKQYNQLGEMQQCNQLITSMTHGVVLASLTGKIISTNEIALQLLGFEINQLECRSYELLFEHCYYETSAILDYYRKIANNERAAIMVKRICGDGHECYLNVTSKIDKALGLLVTTITDQTEKIALIETVNHQKSLSVMGQNVASIVHEIRNPMTSIQGFLQMIKSSGEQQGNPYFQIVETELQRIDEMLVDLLTISKPKKYDVHLVNLKEAVEQVVTLLQVQALEMNVRIVFEYDDTALYFIKGNDNRLRQMLINLLKNAIEAVETDGYIFVQLSYANATTIRLAVEDRGKGMSQEQLQSAFQTFYSTKSSGTGLGLLLVQDVVEEHHGVLTVESIEEVGSNFIIEFDLLLNELTELSNFNAIHMSGKQQTYL